MNESLLSWENARQIISSLPALIKTDSIDIEDACGLVCAEDMCARYASPPFDNSAVDGFVVFSGFEQFKHVSIVESVFAGSKPVFSEFNQDQAVRIMTGAPVPAGAERVVMQEDCTCEGNRLVIHQPGKAGQHMRRQGEDFFSGEKICRAGTIFTPAHIGLLASAGISQVNVNVAPSVGVLLTGDETVDPKEQLNPGQIFNSNLPAIKSALKQMGISIIETVLVEDCEAATTRALTKLASAHNIVITVGGLSVGARDYVLSSLNAINANLLFSRVGIKPGKPLTMAQCQDTLICCLPGNPVSALITMFLFLRPFIGRCCAFSQPESWVTAKSFSTITKKVGRTEFVPGTVLKSEFHPLTVRGSHLLGSLAACTHLAIFPAEKSDVSIGDPLDIVQFSWGFAR
ncbi:MAG: molybdopterin molybdotransferase MoeA [Armatimonadetes bacterium]|nr:molybdopterin molybdotransferase MoeA [Armatimonadota bacterium]